MVRYIKDGAYTIMVDDNGSTIPDGGTGGGGSKTPTSARSLKTEGSKRSLTSKRSNSPPKQTSLLLQKIGEDGGNKEDLSALEEDDIDYTSPSFILQNLKMVQPTYEEDETHILSSRRDLGEIIAHQVAFFVYCLLQAFLNRPDISPIILLFGDGFMGTHIIEMLTECACISFLRIYCRGEIGADEWRRRGYISDYNITRLLTNEKPNIVILSADYYSFHHIFHLLSENHLISAETAIISTTLGFQRKKLFYNLSTPTIFRAFVEPMEVLNSYRIIPPPMPIEMEIKNIVSPWNIIEDEENDDTNINKSNIEDGKSVGSQDTPASSSVVDSMESFQTNADKAAIFLANRSFDIKNILILVENYYALNDVSANEARKRGLRALTGYSDAYVSAMESLIQEKSGKRKKEKALTKKEKLAIQLLEKAILQLYSFTAISFQAEFSRRITLEELGKLAAEFRIDLTIDTSLTKFQEDRQMRHQRRLRQLEKAHAQAQENEDGKEETGSLEKRGAFVVNQGRDHFIRDGKTYHPMHSNDVIFEIFALDDDYSHYEGPAFDYMLKLDTNDQRKSVFRTKSPSQLKEFFSEAGESTSKSPASANSLREVGNLLSTMSGSSSAGNTPMHLHKADAEKSPLRVAHRNAAASKGQDKAMGNDTRDKV